TRNVFPGLVPPESIVSSFDGPARLVDLGLARFAAEGSTSLSPEQSRGYMPDARSDVFALGVALYEALTGRKPWSARRFDDLALDAGLAAPSKANIAISRE